MTTQKAERPYRLWLRRYGRATFVSSWDVQLAAAVFVLGAVLFSVSEQSRAQAYVVLPAVIGVCAGLLGLVLGAIAIVTAFMTRGFVAAVGDIDEVLMPFRTVAAVAAGGIGVALLGLVIQEPAIWQLVVAALSLSSALAVWTVGGVVQLVGLVVLFAGFRAREVSTLLEAEEIRRRRLAQ